MPAVQDIPSLLQYMNILGINFSHDPAVCLIVDGTVVSFVEEEKLSRIKSELVFPSLALRHVLQQQGLSPEQIDMVAFGGHVFDSKTRLEMRYRLTKRAIYRRLDYVPRLLSLVGLQRADISSANQGAFERMIQSAFGLTRSAFVYYPHHLAHAASAHFTTPFEANLSVTCDGRGEADCFNFYVPDARGNLQLARRNGHEASIGQLYSVVTKLLGFTPVRHEGKIMGLAASGKETDLCSLIGGLFFRDNGILKRHPDDAALDRDQHLSFYQRYRALTSLDTDGQSYTLRSMWLLDWLQGRTAGYSPADIAYAIQDVTERVVLEEISHFLSGHESTEPLRLGLSGGVFANVRLNQKIRERPDVENVFVQPAMNDAGLALGAAILADREFRQPDAVHRLRHNYYGAGFSDDIPLLLHNADSVFTSHVMDDPPEEVARLLVENQIVGFYHGNMEFGPRALGHRSIITSTFRKEINAELNGRLNRTEFMPFAPSVLDTYASVYLENYDATCPAADYMTTTYHVSPAYRSLLQAVVHVDGTCRPHVVRRAVNPYYYDVLMAFSRASGCGAVVNTSFNAHEEPIIATPQQAMKALRDGRIDVLILENYCVRRRS
jgi:carbamoyltransferase